jgi:hypothetical protein
MAGDRIRSARIACLFLAVSVLLPAAAGAEPLAVIAAVKGHVEVTAAKGEPTVRASFGRALERGDRVVVAAGGAATIFFNDGNVIELAEKSALTVGGREAARPKGSGGTALTGDVYANVSKFVTGGSRETGLVALSSLRGGADDTPLLLEPRRTELLDGRPTFRWRAQSGASRYRIAVTGDAGELWSREVESDTLEYPTDAPALAPGGDFLWEVRAFSAQGEVRREESYVHVLAADEAASVRAALARIGHSAGGTGSPAARFLSGSYLSGRGLLRDAAEQFEALGLLAPDSPAPHEALGNVYRAIGLTDLAAAEYQRALTLSREP